MNYEKMWNEMKTAYETSLSKLESRGKKMGNAWFTISVVVDKMNEIEASERAKQSKSEPREDLNLI